MKLTKAQKTFSKNIFKRILNDFDWMSLNSFKMQQDVYWSTFYNEFKTDIRFNEQFYNHLIFLKEYQDKEGYDKLKKESINAVNSFIKKMGVEGLGL